MSCQGLVERCSPIEVKQLLAKGSDVRLGKVLEFFESKWVDPTGQNGVITPI